MTGPTFDAENTHIGSRTVRGTAGQTGSRVDVVHHFEPDRSATYPWSDGTARAQDPTYGRIDRDIQWAAWDICTDEGAHPLSSLAQLSAIESTLQERRRRDPGSLPKPEVDDPEVPGVAVAFAEDEGRGMTRVAVVLLLAVMVTGAGIALVLVGLRALGLVR